MPPPIPRFGAPNNIPTHYQHQFQAQNQAHMPFMNPGTLANPFASNGNLGMGGNFGGSGLNMMGGTGLASQAAQMSFAGAGGQNGTGDAGVRGGANKRIRDVWKGNLEEELGLLRTLVDKYQYISMVSSGNGSCAMMLG